VRLPIISLRVYETVKSVIRKTPACANGRQVKRNFLRITFYVLRFFTLTLRLTGYNGKKKRLDEQEINVLAMHLRFD